MAFQDFTRDATDENDSTRLTDEHWKRFDRFLSQLADGGIYYGWSPFPGHRIRPGDRDQLVAYDEVAALRYPMPSLNGSTAGLVNFAPDLQDLHIEFIVNMLNHVNPHTGRRYAEDPALAFINLLSEDDIFGPVTRLALERAPTYRAMLSEQFSEWLSRKYGTQGALEDSWGAGVIPEGESLAARNVFPEPDMDLFQNETREAYRWKREMPAHILDIMRFLYERQARFYERLAAAIRATGYRGVIAGSGGSLPGAGIANLYSLHADALAGMIGRHSDAGGKGGRPRRSPGGPPPAAMVSRPGVGLLNAGLHQVENRPFALSWRESSGTNAWAAEAASIVAAYGTGLQGWDASFSRPYALTGSSDSQDTTIGGQSLGSPTQLALYPAIARLVHRQDVAEGGVVSRRQVHLPSLAVGRLGFYEAIEQAGERKYVTGDAPAEGLAYGRMVVSFSETFERTVPLNLEEMSCCGDETIYANNGQLIWDTNNKGYFTIDTPGTQGVVGFAGGRSLSFADFRITVENPFAVILVTAMEKDARLESAERILVTALARVRFPGTGGGEAADKAAVLMEPVSFRLDFRRAGRPEVHVLDHGGGRTGKRLPIEAGSLAVDGRATQAITYELVF